MTWRSVIGVALGAALALAPDAHGWTASFELTAAQQRAAIELGRASATGGDLGGEWTVTADGGDTATVMTPFYRLAWEARMAAFRGQALSARDVDRLLKDVRGKIRLWVTLRGPSPDFARYYVPELTDGKTTPKAALVQNERTALPDGGRFVARCLYVFPTGQLDPRSRLTLVVRDAQEAERARFTLDLAAMR